MFTVISVLLLSAHLMCMNVSSAGPLLCVWLARRNAHQASAKLAKSLSLWTVWLLLAGIVLGLALGLGAMWRGDRSLVDVLPFFKHKIAWGIVELSCSLGWMTGYWAWLRWRPPTGRATRYAHAGLAVLSATNLLYHFPILLTVMSRCASGEIAVDEHVNAAMFRALAWQPNVMAHAVHFWLASIAVSGVFLFWLVRKEEEAESFLVLGARVALVATALQLPVGLWLLFVTPQEAQTRLVGGDALTSGLFVVSLFCAFYLLQNLASIAFGEVSERLLKRSAALLIVTVVLMSGTLHLIRG